MLLDTASNSELRLPHAWETFEISQRLEEKWLTAESSAKRQILEMFCLNLKLDGASLVFETRKPSDLLAEGLLLENSRGDRRLTFPNESAGHAILCRAISQTIMFEADALFKPIEA